MRVDMNKLEEDTKDDTKATTDSQLVQTPVQPGALTPCGTKQLTTTDRQTPTEGVRRESVAGGESWAVYPGGPEAVEVLLRISVVRTQATPQRVEHRGPRALLVH